MVCRTIFRHDRRGNIGATQWLLSPPVRVRNEPVQLAIAEQRVKNAAPRPEHEKHYRKPMLNSSAAVEPVGFIRP